MQPLLHHENIGLLCLVVFITTNASPCSLYLQQMLHLVVFINNKCFTLNDARDHNSLNVQHLLIRFYQFPTMFFLLSILFTITLHFVTNFLVSHSEIFVLSNTSVILLS